MAIYVENNLIYKIRDDLSISDNDQEILTIEIINRESRNILISCCDKPPTGDRENLSSFLKNIFEISYHENKKCYMLGDFNINCFDYDENEKVKNFYNSVRYKSFL